MASGNWPRAPAPSAAASVMASENPYTECHARFTPCIYNTAEEIDRALEAVAGMG